MKAKALSLCLALALAALAAACGGNSGGNSSGGGHRASQPFTVTRMESATGQAEVLLTPRGALHGLVLYEHGYGQTQNAMLEDPPLAPLRDALLKAGFAVAASYSHGNNFGNPASVEDQVRLLHDAEARLPAVPRVGLVGFSMGGLDTLLVASGHLLAGLHNVVLLSPVCNQIPYIGSNFGPDIRAAYGDPTGGPLLTALTGSDPERRDPHSYAGYGYWFWESPDDTTVRPVEPASMMSILHSAGIAYRFSLLNGNHGDLQRLQPAQVVAFLAGP